MKKQMIDDGGRRLFVKGFGFGIGAVATGLLTPQSVFAQTSAAGPTTPAILSGTDFDLTIGNTPINITGRSQPTMSVNGSIPAPTLRWREGAP